MLLIGQFVIFFLSIAAECSNDAEAKNERNHPKRIPFGFPIPFVTGYYDRSKPFPNLYETRQEKELMANKPSMLTMDFEREIKDFDLDFINKIFKDRLSDRKNENLKDAERLQSNKIEESKETKQSILPNPLSIWNEKRFGEQANILRNVEHRDTENTRSKDTQTAIASAIIFRDDDYDMKVNEDKKYNIAKENRFADVSTQINNHPIQNKNDTEIIKNIDYFMIPITMPISTIASSITGLSDNANSADTNLQIVQNTKTLPAVYPASNLIRSIQSTNNLMNGAQAPQAVPIQYFNVVPQNQGLPYAVNNVPSNLNGNVLNNQANSMLTVLNIPNTAAQQAINGKQQGVVYYLLNQGNGINGANVPSAYQLVSFPNNNIVLGQGGNVVPNNQPMQLSNIQTNFVGASNQPNNLMILNSPSNNNQATNTIPLYNQQSLVTFPNKPNLSLNNQLNVEATYSMPQNNHDNLGQATNAIPQNNQNLVEATNSMPLITQANLVPLKNQRNLFTLSNQPKYLMTMTSLPNNMVAFTNQPTVVTFTNPSPNQVNLQNSMTFQPNNASMANLPVNQNQPNNIVALLNQLNNNNNNQAGNLAFVANQGNNGILENPIPIQSNILAVLANQPAQTGIAVATVPRQSGSGTTVSNNQLSNIQVVPNVSNDPVNHPSLIANGQANQGKEFTLMDTKDDAEELFI